MTKYPMWLLIGAAVLGVLVALVFVIPQAPVSEKQGTAPSMLDTQLAERGCENVPEPEKRRCLQDAQAARAGSSADQANTSSNTSRAARGSGVEGVTSGGTTTSGGGTTAPEPARGR